MMLYYYDVTGHRNVMDDKYYPGGNRNQLSDGLTKELFNIERHDGTTPVEIHRVVKKYLSNHGWTSGTDHTSRFFGFFTQNTIAGLSSKNQPVELFGYVRNGVNDTHAVLAYGYEYYLNGTKIVYNFIVHMGYNLRPKVTLDATPLSMYSLAC